MFTLSSANFKPSYRGAELEDMTLMAVRREAGRNAPAVTSHPPFSQPVKETNMLWKLPEHLQAHLGWSQIALFP